MVSVPAGREAIVSVAVLPVTVPVADDCRAVVNSN